MNVRNYFLLSALTLANVCSAATIEVRLVDNLFQLSSNTVKAGPVEFQVINNSSTQTHEMIVMKADVDESNLPLDNSGRVDEDKVITLGEVADLKPGESGSKVFNLTPGKYTLFCNEPGHYQTGMHTTLIVTD